MTARRDTLHSPVTRRRLLGAGVATSAGLAASALVGCGGDSTQTPVASATPVTLTPQRGGVLRTLGGPVGSILDVQRAKTAAELLLWQWTGNTLVRWSAAAPYLAEADLAVALPEQLDGATVTFKLRQEATWQNRAPVNGRPVVAQDVKASFDRIRALGAQAPRGGNYVNIDSVTAIDDQTVQFKLKTPQADFLNILADQGDAILPAEIVARGDAAIAKLEDVVGSGPYELTTFEAGKRIVVTRRADGYWKPNSAWLDGWSLLSATDEAQKANALFAATADVADVSTAVGRIFDASPGFQVSRATNPARECIVVNHTVSPWKDARVRLAFARAMNRTQIYPSVLEGAGIAAGAMTPAALEWVLSDAELAKLPGFGDRASELTEAKALLSAAGYSGGFDDKFVVVAAAQLPDIANLIIANVAEAGIRLKVETVGDFNLAVDRAKRADYSLLLTQFLAGIYPDAQLYLYHHSKNGVANYGKYASTDLDAKLDKQRTLFNHDERLALVQDIQRYIVTNPGPVWIGSRIQATAAAANVQAFRNAPFSTGYDLAENSWLKLS